MRVSVITATRNLIAAGRAEMFRQNVASVRAQHGAEVEHVVVDGASDDGSRETIAAMAAAGEIDAFRSAPDSGVYEAMNRGAALATGAYLVFLNSDDYLIRADGIADLVRHARDWPDFVAAPVLCLDAEGGRRVLGVSRFYARVLVTMPFCHQGLAMRRDLFERLGGFDLGYRILGDYDLVLRMFLGGGRGVRMARPFAAFRPGGISSDVPRLRAEYRAIWRRQLPGGEGVSEAEWEAAGTAGSLPRPVLRAVAASPGMPARLRWVARWRLIRGS